MAWLEFTVETTPRSIDSVVTALSARGFSDLVIEDQSEFETFLEENRAYWDYIDEGLQKKLEGLSRIKLYLEDTDDHGRKRLDAAVKELGLTMTVAPLPETDWEESWKDNYPPQEIGDHIVVLPYWLAEEPTHRLKVILDPGLTFGTGAHPSTQMVMEVMENVVKPGFHCLDLGSGSGILSIAALRLGAESAIGIDIDPMGALEIASRSRGTPRIANRLLRRVRDFAQVYHDGVITKDAADHALGKLEVDHLGLDAIDRRMLTAIIRNYGGGPVGLETLAATIGEEAVTLEDVYEPYLMQIGFLTRTPRGRCVTQLAYEHLHLPVPQSAQVEQLSF